jgi:hypothetical protein
MKTAVIVSGVVRYMVEASSSWKFDVDYYLIGDEYLHKRRVFEPFGKFQNEFTDIIQNTKVNFSQISIVSRTNISENDWMQHDAVINMLWKWKCSYHIIKPYDDTIQYDKFLIIRPDIYLSPNTDFNYINDIVLDDNTIHTMENTHMVNRGDMEVVWMNDIFLLFNRDVFFKISKIYDFYIKNYLEILEKKYDIHAFLGEYFKEENIIIKGGISKFIDFIVLTEDICNDMFDNGYLKSNYIYNDIWKYS